MRPEFDETLKRLWRLMLRPVSDDWVKRWFVKQEENVEDGLSMLGEVAQNGLSGLQLIKKLHPCKR